MSIKTFRPIFYVLLILISSIFYTEVHGQTVVITHPSSLRTFTELTSVGGTVSGRDIARVRIAIGKLEDDEEWARDDRGNYRWRTGPTGQWLETQLEGNRWSAPSGYSLPSGSDLPDGKYVIHAYAETRSGVKGRMIRKVFTIRQHTIRRR